MSVSFENAILLICDAIAIGFKQKTNNWKIYFDTFAKTKKKKTKKHTVHNRPGMVRERVVAIEVYTHGIYCRFGMTHKQFTCWLLDNLRTYTHEHTHTPIGFLYGCNIAYGQSQFHINLYIYRNMHFNLSMRMSWHAFVTMMIYKTAIARRYFQVPRKFNWN